MRRSSITFSLLVSALALPLLVARGVEPQDNVTDFHHARWAYSEPTLIAHPQGGGALAWLAFDGERDRVCASFRTKSGWSDRALVSPRSGAYLPPVLAATGAGRFWVVWPARRDGAYDLFARRIGPAGGEPIERVTEHAAPDLEPAVAVSPAGELFVAWQSRRHGDQEVLVKRRTGTGWSAPVRVSEDPAADIQPALAFDARGRAWVTWSTWRHGHYADGNYEVYAARLEDGAVVDRHRVSTSERADLFPRFVAVGERLALVWTESSFALRRMEEATGPDLLTVAYDQWRDKSYRVAWLSGDVFGSSEVLRVRNAKGEALEVSDFARPVVSPNGRSLLLVHQTLFDKPAMRKRWGLAVAAVRDSGVGPPIDASAGASGPGGRFDAAWLDGRLFVVDTASEVADGESPVAKRGSWLRVRRLDGPSLSAPTAAGLQTLSGESAPADLMAAEPTRSERVRVRADDLELTAYFGNLHLHSDLSTDGRGHEGTPQMNYQVVQDLAQLDFAGLSDHIEWWLDGHWWTVRKVADVWNRPGHFVTLPGYEWTSFKYGHKNVYFRDHAAADAGAAIHALGKTPDDLWEQLGDRAAIAIPHHPAHRITAPTDWSFRSDRFQRLVEIFQVRGSFEFDGGPYQGSRDRRNSAKGRSVQDALRMGHRLGFIASPDHGGGFGLAGVWAPELTRLAIYEGLHARRTFGTTGTKMTLWFTVNGVGQGTELDHRTGPFALHGEVNGTAAGLKLAIVSDGEDLTEVEFEGTRAVLDWQDHRPPGARGRYYYLRATQSDGHMGWTSPVWIEGRG